MPVADGCFGDGSAGCCGARQCSVLAEEANDQVSVTTQVETIEGEEHTTFGFEINNPTSFNGENLDQIALLLTLNSMAELSTTHTVQQLAHAEDTHIGCNPLDGFIAWRQTLPCLACQAEKPATYQFSVAVKVCIEAPSPIAWCGLAGSLQLGYSSLHSNSPVD